MRLMHSTTLCILLGFAAAGPVHSSAPGDYYDRHSEGWFWYEDPEEEVEEPEEEEVAKTPEPPEEQPPEEQPPEEVPMAERPYGTEWLREEIKQATRSAIDDPSEENLQRYIMLNRVARAKGTRFAERLREVAAKDPTLDGLDTVQPSAARADRREHARRETQKVLSQLSESVGLWFVHDDGPFARIQARTMERMATLHGIAVREVTDGPKVSEQINDMDIDMREPLNLKGEGPWVVAVHTPTESVELIAQGPQARTSMEQTLIYAAGVHGWIERNEMRAAMGASDPIDPVLEDADRIMRTLEPASGSEATDQLLQMHQNQN